MKTGDISIIELNGSSRKRGNIHGELLKDSIAEIVDRWLSDLGTYGQDSNAGSIFNTQHYLEEFFSKTHYLPVIKQQAPELLEELSGIAEASGQNFEHILGLNLLDEEWVFGATRKYARPSDKCTAFGIPRFENAVSYAGQNMDVGSWVEGHQVLFRHMPMGDIPEIFMFSIAGSLGLNGLNASGLGVTCNTLSQLANTTDGLPVVFVLRSLLMCQSVEAATAILSNIKHASGQNYILSSAGDIRCFECSGTSVVRYAPDHLQGRIFHTNHPLVSNDTSSFEPMNHCTPSTIARLQSITQRLGAVGQSVSLENIKAALAAHDDINNPVSRNTNNEGSSIGFTAGASIYEFGPKPRLHLAAGPPCGTDFQTFEFNTL